MDRKEVHDFHLAAAPEGARHDPCELCTDSGGNVDFTTEQQAEIQRQIDAAVASATGPLKTELETLRKGSEDAALQAKIDDAVATAAGEKADLQKQLDDAVAAKAAAEKEFADFKEATEKAEADRKAAEEAASRKDERIAAVAAVIDWPK